MLNLNFSCTGCMTLILGSFILLFLFKFWFIIIAFILFFLVINRRSGLFTNLDNTGKEKEFVSKPGKVYKVCSYCQKKSERKETVCNYCGRPFEMM